MFLKLLMKLIYVMILKVVNIRDELHVMLIILLQEKI